MDNLTKAVEQLREVSQNIQDNSCNEHEAFGNFVAATLNNLPKSNALMAQHDIQGILLKYRLADVGSPQHNSVAPQTPLDSRRNSYDNNSLPSEYCTNSTGSSNSATYDIYQVQKTSEYSTHSTGTSNSATHYEIHEVQENAATDSALYSNEESIISRALLMIDHTE